MYNVERHRRSVSLRLTLCLFLRAVLWVVIQASRDLVNTVQAIFESLYSLCKVLRLSRDFHS